MKVTFAGAVKSAFVNFATFRSVSTKPEYWYFVLFTFLLYVVTSVIQAVIWRPSGSQDIEEILSQPAPFSTISFLVVLLPFISVTVRRLRDAGWSGKWLWSLLVPITPFLYGTIGIIGYLDSVIEPTVEGLASHVAYLALAFGLFLMVFLFLVILTVRPSKSKEDGNRYAE
jgi:uncharacterized membrane protein YhaH (DUF805 family)